MPDGLIMAWVLFAWGAQAAVPWRLPGQGPGARRFWAMASLPLLIGGVVAALFYVQAHPDAAIASGLYPLKATRPGRLLLVLLPALLLAGVVTALGWKKLEDAGWRIAAGFGLAFLAAASWAAELVRIGEGPESAPLPLALLVLCRLLLGLAAGEIAAPGRPLFAVAAGLAFPLYWLLLPANLANALTKSGALVTLGASALVLLTARWLPERLRRPALGAAILLAGLVLAQATMLSQTLASPTMLPPMDLPGVR
ncbi:MAG TPA: hypothetical protein VJ725_02715 [Thermoanaerobaculia bacterium]|nr:hypothetical protein [Thermoanaerobaculia bacterium]